MIRKCRLLVFITLLILIAGCLIFSRGRSVFNESPIWIGQEQEVYVYNENVLIFYNPKEKRVEKTEDCPRVRYAQTKTGGFYVTCQSDPNQKDDYNDSIKFFDAKGNEVFKFGDYTLIHIKELNNNLYMLRGEIIEGGEFKSNTIVVVDEKGNELVNYKTNDHNIDLDDVYFYHNNNLLYTEDNSEMCWIPEGSHRYRNNETKCLHKVEDDEITVSKGPYKKLNYLSIVNESNYIYSYLTPDNQFYLAEIDQHENEIWKIGPYKDINGISKTTKGYILSATDNVTYQTYILHIDENGNELWRHLPVYLKKPAIQLNNGSFVFAHASPDYYVKCLNQDGEVIWSKKIDGEVKGFRPLNNKLVVYVNKGTRYYSITLDEDGNIIDE